MHVFVCCISHLSLSCLFIFVLSIQDCIGSSLGDWDEDEYSYDDDNDEEMVNDRTSDAMARNERELAKLNAIVELNVEGMPHQLGSAMDGE